MDVTPAAALVFFGQLGVRLDPNRRCTVRS